MELILLLFAPVMGFQILKAQEQRRRIMLLGQHLGHYQIERLMENLVDGYMRALDEPTAERRAQIWSLMQTAEQELATQFRRFTDDFAKVWSGQTLVSTLAMPFPHADKLFPRQTFDMRELLAVHAEGIASTADNTRQLSLRDKAYTMTAELLLMQHSCHWFCRTRAVASARMQARHQTSHAQLIAAVSPATRAAYQKLTGVN